MGTGRRPALLAGSLVLATIAVLAAGPAPGQGTAPAPALLDGFAAFVDRARQEWDVPAVAVAVVQADEALLVQGFGTRDREKKLPATARTLFGIGSCSKAFTTFVMAQLVDEGKLAWDRPVRSWMPEFALADPVASERVTPLDLVTHRTGLARHDAFWINGKLPRAEMVRRLRYLEMGADLRAEYIYSNLAYVAAGQLVEKVSGASWEDVVRRRVLGPLGMTATTLSVHDSQKAADFAVPYEIRGDEVARSQFRDVTDIGPAGAVNTTAEDVVPWLRVLANGGRLGTRQVIAAAALADLFVPRMETGARPSATDPEVIPGGYAVGWGTSTYRGVRRISHGGAVRGFGALVTVVPERKLAIAVFVNVEGSGLPEVVSRHALDRLLGLPQRDWSGERLARRKAARELERQAEGKKASVRREGTRPAHPLDEYAGEYENPGYGLLSITRQGDALAMTYNDIRTPLEHWHFEVWNGLKQTGELADNLYADQRVLFRTGYDGEVSAVEAPLEPRVAPIVFTRRPDRALSDPAVLGKLAGTYAVGIRRLVVRVRETDLLLEEGGRPPVRLVPDRSFRFRDGGAAGRTLQFVVGADGTATELKLIQPDGVTTAARERQGP